METTIEYNEQNLPVKYTTTDKFGQKDVSTISYKYLNKEQ